MRPSNATIQIYRGRNNSLCSASTEWPSLMFVTLPPVHLEFCIGHLNTIRTQAEGNCGSGKYRTALHWLYIQEIWPSLPFPLSECGGGPDALMVLLVVVGSILLVGIVLLAAWKLVITIHDRREFARFQSARSRARYEMVRMNLITPSLQLLVGNHLPWTFSVEVCVLANI